MKVSLQLANQYSNVDLLAVPIDELLVRIGAQLGAVEEVIDWTHRFDKAVVARIISCHQHPNADKLKVCLIDDGQVSSNVERDAEGLVQIVCGAPNVRDDLLVVWLPPGATVPSTVDKDPFVLSARDFRGVVSNGMLASAAELGISDDHSGILELEEPHQPGDLFGELYGLNDIIIDCENKMFTHRPDCFGVLGVARELAGICGLQFTSPGWYNLNAVNREPQVGSLSFTSKNEAPDFVARFMLQVVENVQVKQSRLEIQTALSRLGSRPINNLVDFSNYYMYLTAQPTHAFDYDKVKALCVDGEKEVTIFPRMAQAGETLELLNGKTITLTEKDIVIATDKQAISLAGVMGGAATEVDETTKNIIVECANFDMYEIRRMSMRHGLFSDAVTRFNKGQSHLQNPVVLQKIIEDICADTGGTAGLLYDSNPEESSFSVDPVVVTTTFINSRLGSSLSAEEMQQLLTNVECTVAVSEEGLVVTPPFWRKDIELPEDVVEEIGRLYGFDKLPILLPRRSIAPVAKNPHLVLNENIRTVLSGAGANEVLTYSFVSDKLIRDAGQAQTEAYQLSNALSPELQYYRLSLTPSLLAKVNQNIRAGYNKIAIFELGKTHLKLQGVNDEGLPQENAMLSLVYAASEKTVSAADGAAYYQAKVYVEHLARALGLEFDYQSVGEASYEIIKPYDPTRSALLIEKKSGSYVGIIGEFTASVRRSFKLPVKSAGFEIMLAPILEITSSGKAVRNYRALARFPGTSQDISFKTALDKKFGDLFAALQNVANVAAMEHGFTVSTAPIDIYRKENAKTNHVTFRLNFYHPNRSVTTNEVTKLVDQVVANVGADQDVERI